MNLKQQLIEFEGKVNHCYFDHLGYATIGVGRLIDERKGGGLSDDEIDLLLENDIKAKTKQVLEAFPWVANLNEPRQAVIIGMAFQLGIRGLSGFRSMLGACRDEHFADAAEHMRQSLWAKQTPKRVHRMAHQMETGEWN